MKLPVAVKEIADCSHFQLAAHLPAPTDPVWTRNDLRQKQFDVHADTRSIVFAWPLNWRLGQRQDVMSYSYAPAALTAAVTSCAASLAALYDGQVVRLMAAELCAGGSIAEHIDAGPSLPFVHRCHVPIVTNDDVEFTIEDVAYRFREGIAYEIDNTRRHAVANRGQTPRVHLICDVLPRIHSGGA